MATINFLYRSTKDKANLHLRLLYRLNDVDYVFGVNTKLQVSKEYWTKLHKKKSKQIDITNEQTRINNELNKIENHVLNAFNIVDVNLVNKEWLQKHIEYYYNPPKQIDSLPTGLLNYIDHYIDIRKNELTEGSLKKFKVNKQLLIRYQKHFNTVLLISDINSSFKIKFERYCLDNNYAPNTIARMIRFFKTICRHAKSNGLETSYQLDNMTVKYHKVDSIYLTFEDLEKIEEIKEEKLTESLINVRDWLIISCYTGQRVSDFMRFTSDMIRVEKGKSLIEFTQKKTGKIMTVPLHPKVLEILEKKTECFLILSQIKSTMIILKKFARLPN